jgi:hypothetical protein
MTRHRALITVCLISLELTRNFFQLYFIPVFRLHVESLYTDQTNYVSAIDEKKRMDARLEGAKFDLSSQVWTPFWLAKRRLFYLSPVLNSDVRSPTALISPPPWLSESFHGAAMSSCSSSLYVPKFCQRVFHSNHLTDVPVLFFESCPT